VFRTTNPKAHLRFSWREPFPRPTLLDLVSGQTVRGPKVSSAAREVHSNRHCPDALLTALKSALAMAGAIPMIASRQRLPTANHAVENTVSISAHL
jgi:hypothetical protein